MSRIMRTVLVVAAVVAAVVAFAVLRPEEQATVSEPTPQAEGTPAAAVDDQAATPTPTPAPRLPLLTAGAPRKLSVRQGETVAFRVRNPSAEELHVHGYDIARPLPAGKTVTVRFPARLEGIFEIELEHSHTPIGSLQVEP